MKARTMKAENLRQRLLAAGRCQPPADTVPYAFEKRIIARLSQRLPDPVLLWNRVLWRCAGPCVALTLLAGILAWYGQAPATAAESVVTELETAIYAPLASSTEVW
jgi:hypothetical protein